MRYFLSVFVIIVAMNVSDLCAQERKPFRSAGAVIVTPVIETLDLSSYEYEPGDVITVTGRSFGEQDDKVLTVYFYRPGGFMSFYMDLNVISWIDKRIVAHVPGMDSSNFRLASDHYGTSANLPDNIKNYMGRYWVQGKIEIARKPDQVLSNEMPIRIGPATTEGPVVRFIPRGQAERSGSFWIYGDGFNADAGRVFLKWKSGNRITELKEIDEWSSTMIKAKVPATVSVGEYELFVRDADGYESNKMDLDVKVTIESGTKVEGKIGAEEQRYEHEQEPLEGSIPGKKVIHKEPPLEGTITPSE